MPSVKYPAPTSLEPDMDELYERSLGDGIVEATDGCKVEPDGTCEHGHASWLLYWGLV